MNEIAQLTDLFSAEEGLNFNTGRAARLNTSGKPTMKPAVALRLARESLGMKKGHLAATRVKSVA